MAKASTIPITPSVLKWAIEESGYSISQLATETDVQPDAVRGWATGASQPRLTELRALAAKLKRPVAVFLLPSPPKSAMPAVEFRHAAGGRRATLNPEERRRLREAVRLQRVLSWISREMHEDAPVIPRSSITEAPESVADRARENLRVRIEDQISSTSGSMSFHVWRNALEQGGISVLLLSMGEESCRGFSLWDDGAPIVAVNTSWNAEARLFTLLHEYGHLITRTNSACVETGANRTAQASDGVERWCERFAAAALLPPGDLRQYVARLTRSDAHWTADVQSVGRIARHFKVSLRAATLRLIEMGLAQWSLYRSLPPAADRKREGAGGGAGRTRSQVRTDQYGNRVFGLFREALTREVVGAGDVLDYLDIPLGALRRSTE